MQALCAVKPSYSGKGQVKSNTLYKGNTSANDTVFLLYARINYYVFLVVYQLLFPVYCCKNCHRKLNTNRPQQLQVQRRHTQCTNVQIVISNIREQGTWLL